MEKYHQLIDYLKEEYLGSSFGFAGKKNRDSEALTAPDGFDIDIKEDTSLGMPVKEFSIRSLDDNASWEMMVCPASFLYSMKLAQRRYDLLMTKRIRGIITLKNTFFRYSTIPTAVILFGTPQGDVWLTSALSSDDLIAIMYDISIYGRKVYYTNKLNPENFMPEFYNGETKEVDEVLDKYETRELQDIAEIISGKNARPYQLAPSGIPYLRGRNISDGKIVNVEAFIPEDMVDEFAKQLLQEGDILLQKQFGYHKVARVEESDLPAIASSGLFIIRAFGVPEDYLYSYITSETGSAIFEKQLKSIERGATIVSINMGDLKRLRVPIFDEQTMADFSNVENLKISELKPAMKRLTAYAEYVYGNKNGESDLERKVVDSFYQVGWAHEDLKVNATTFLLEGSKLWEADIALLDAGNLLAVVETRHDVSLLNPAWVKNMNAIIASGNVPALIITTGAYYEIHVVKTGAVKKMMSPPSKELLMSMLNGKGEN